ncbi:hypothetical protein [Leptolyngbya sp. PCC 6406]|uniref:hypothetical protein n=1 Tax=Leptolyngbya sp. PCC 6406 TaxID=1173264 RepID=UPI0002ABC600|nr:hypothetical protein [Leptolyngbya sp. PCC 6406]
MSTRKVTIKSLDLLSTGKIQAIILAVFALIFAVLFAVFMLLLGSAANEMVMGIGSAIAFVIFVPILYGIVGFVAGVVGALIYNLAAGAVGGIQFEFKYDEGQL